MSQVIELIGIVDDGSQLHPTLPRNTAREIQFPRLGDARIELDIFFPSGRRVTGGSALTMTMQRRLVAGRPGPELLLTGVFTDPGIGVITVASTATQIFTSGRIHYDIWLTVNALKYQIVRTGIVRLAPNITRNP